MSWRVVVIKSKSKLDYKMDYLVIRTESKVSRVHLSEISVLLIESTAVSLTAYLLSELVKKKIKVIFCDEKYNPQSELVSLYGSYDTSRKIHEQISWKTETKKIIWAKIVRAKIIGQISNLPNDSHYAEELLSKYVSFKDIVYRKNNILLLETLLEDASKYEKVLIVDKDMCEI